MTQVDLGKEVGLNSNKMIMNSRKGRNIYRDKIVMLERGKIAR